MSAGITVLPVTPTRAAPAGAATSPRRPSAAIRSPTTTIAASSIGALPSPTISRAPSNTVAAPGVWPGAALVASRNVANATRQDRIDMGLHIPISSLSDAVSLGSAHAKAATADKSHPLGEHVIRRKASIDRDGDPGHEGQSSG